MAYDSKYTGAEVEALLDKIGSGGGKLEYVDVTPVISGSTATYTIPAGVVANCVYAGTMYDTIINLDFSTLEPGEMYQFHILVFDDAPAALSIGYSEAAGVSQFWIGGSIPSFTGSGATLEMDLICTYAGAGGYLTISGTWGALTLTE